MTHRRSLVIALVAAVALAVGVGGIVGVRLSADPAPGTSTDAPAGALPGRADGRSGTNAHGGSESVPEPSGTPTSGSSGAPRATTRGGVRVQPEAPGPATGGPLPGLSGGSGGSGSSAAALPAWTDLPTHATFAVGRMATGYPDRLLPATPHGSVVNSSVSPSSGHVQVALVARRAQGADAVVRFYRARLTRAGFTESAVPPVGGATATSFQRGKDQVVVTVDPGSARTYSVYATFVVGKA